MVEQLPEGLYESIESEAIAGRLASDRDSRNEMRVIEKDQLTESLVQHASEALRQHIDRAKEPSEKIRLTNLLLEGIGAPDQKITQRGFELRLELQPNARRAPCQNLDGGDTLHQVPFVVQTPYT